MTKQSQSSGDNSTNIQVGGDINFIICTHSNDLSFLHALNNKDKGAEGISEAMYTKLVGDFKGSYVGDNAESLHTVKHIQSIIGYLDLIEPSSRDSRFGYLRKWKIPSSGYSGGSFNKDLKKIHEFCGGKLVLSAPSPCAASSSCFLKIANELKVRFGTECIIDIYGRTAREHVDRLIENPEQDFFVTLTDVFFQLEELRDLPFTLLNIVNSSNQRLYRRKSRLASMIPAVYVPEFSTGNMQARLKIGVPGNTKVEVLPTAGRLVEHLDDISPGDFVIAWDPLWYAFQNSNEYEVVNVGDYVCYHGLFYNTRWASDSAKDALSSFISVYCSIWLRNRSPQFFNYGYYTVMQLLSEFALTQKMLMITYVWILIL